MHLVNARFVWTGIPSRPGAWRTSWERSRRPLLSSTLLEMAARCVVFHYHLHLTEDDAHHCGRPLELAEDPIAFAFALLWVAVLALIIYNALKSCFGSRTRTDTRGGSTPRAPPPRGPGSGWFSGWGTHPDSYDPPPPYTKHAPHSGQGVGDAGGWRPGFWTGAALGWLGTQWMNRQREQQYVRAPGMYDWEAERMFAPRVVRTAPLASPSSASWWGGAARRRGFDDGDRGEGPSDLGRMRRSTGLGGSNVR